MSNLSPEARVWLQYAAIGAAAFLGDALIYIVPLLMDPSEPPISWRMVLGSGLGAIAAVYFGAKLPRPGKARVSRQINALERVGVKPDEMQVTAGLESILDQHQHLQDAGVKTQDMVLVPSPASGVSVSMARFSNKRIYEILDPSEMDAEEARREREAVRNANG